MAEESSTNNTNNNDNNNNENNENNQHIENERNNTITSTTSSSSSPSLELIGKWNGKEYPIIISPSDTIQDLKHKLEVINHF